MEKLNFKEFVGNTYQYSDLEIANLYFSAPNMKIEEISKKTLKSITELYQIIHRHGKPNRLKINHFDVEMWADSGLPTKRIAELTGYTTRHIRNLLKEIR